MPLLARRSMIAAVLLLLTLFSASAPAQQPGLHQTQDLLEGHSRRVLTVNRGVEEVFGPLPAVAATPFLGLAVLSSVALLVEQPAIANSNSVVIHRIRQNPLILEAKMYASWWLVGALLLLALVTGLANSGKLQGGLGKFFRSTEDVTSGIAYLVVAVGALTSASAATLAPRQPTVLLASVLPSLGSGDLPLILITGSALASLMLVRFALDLIIWLNPVPFIDAIFETLKSAFSLLFLAIYLLNPVLAAVLGAVLLLPVLFLLPWAVRLLGFVYRIVFCPILARIFPALAPGIMEPALAKKASGSGAIALACRASVLKARGLKKRQAIALLHIDGRVVLRPLRQKRRARELCKSEEQVQLGRALAWIELRVVDQNGRTLDRFALPRSLGAEFEMLRGLLGADDIGGIGAMRALHAAGKAAREGIDSAARIVKPRAEAQ